MVSWSSAIIFQAYTHIAIIHNELKIIRSFFIILKIIYIWQASLYLFNLENQLEEGNFFTILSTFYYCNYLMIVSSLFFLFIIVVSLYILSMVVDHFLIPTIYIVRDRLKLTDDQTGVLTSFISSAPELSVSMISLFLAIKANDAEMFAQIASMGPGAVIGSALFSVLFIVWASAWYCKKPLTRHSVTRDMGYYILAIVVLYTVLMDKMVYRYEAAILLWLYILYTYIVSKRPQISKYLPLSEPTHITTEQIQEKEEELIKIHHLPWTLWNAGPKLIDYVFFETNTTIRNRKLWSNVGIAIILVILSSYIMVDYADQLAQLRHIPQVIIALTILAAGTSVPDLLASVKTAREWYGDMAITNAIGSNVFDVLGNLGITWVVSSIFTAWLPVAVDTNNLNSSIYLLIASSVTLLLVLFAIKFRINKIVSGLLMLLYLSYVVYLCISALR